MWRKKLAAHDQCRKFKDYLDKFQQMISGYNACSLNIEQFFEELIKLAQSLTEEEKRGVAESLSEEELALFDLLTKPEPKLTKKQETDVKKVVRNREMPGDKPCRHLTRRSARGWCRPMEALAPEHRLGLGISPSPRLGRRRPGSRGKENR